jgi:hypothetical protein
VHIQNIVDSAPEVDFYRTDGYYGYLDVVFPGDHVRNNHRFSQRRTNFRKVVRCA